MEHIRQRRKPPTRSKTFIAGLAVILTLATAAAVTYWRYVYPTGRILPDLYAVRTHNNSMPMGNFFLMCADEKYIAIDAGADEIETANALRKLRIPAGDVVAVFITHAHWDHIGSLGLFDSAVIYTGNTQGSKFPDVPHQVMSDGETIEISDMSVQCIYTPGHTIDSVCFLVDGKYLFVGDLFITTNDSPFEKRYDPTLQLLYRREVLEIGAVEYVFTGHFGLFKDVRLFRWWF